METGQQEPKFIHLRKLKPVQIGFDNYVHLEVSEKGGLTLAAIEKTGLFNEPYVVYTKARCSKRDNFCRKIGRNIAKRRLFSDKAIKSVFKGDLFQFEQWAHNSIKA